MPKKEVDRSRIITGNRCDRERYYGYEIFGTGLQRRRKALPLEFGSGFHAGAERLLIGDVEGAVKAGDDYLTSAFNGAGIDFGDESPADVVKAAEYGMAEQRALCEAILRAWDAWEGEVFRRDFEISEIEQEGRADLDDHLTLMFRADAVVKEKMSGDSYVVSWKSRATHTARSARQDRRDMQSCSEVYGLQNRLCMDEGCEHHGTPHICNPLKLEGVLYKIVLKGRREKDEWDGLYKQNTHLVYGWKKLGDSPEETEWSWKYSWTDESEVNPKTGKPVGKKLGKGWKKVAVWEEYPRGVKGWIADLAAQRVSPRHLNALEAIFPAPLPVERRPDEIESWRRQTVIREMERAAKSQYMRSLPMDSEDYKIALDECFPQDTDRCEDYSGCQFRAICFEGVGAEVGELYQIRIPNHVEKGDGDE